MALTIGSFGDLIEGLSKLMVLDYTTLSWLVIGLPTIVTIAELSFAFWLVVKGLNEEKMAPGKSISQFFIAGWK